jgi:hypothetical protein
VTGPNRSSESESEPFVLEIVIDTTRFQAAMGRAEETTKRQYRWYQRWRAAVLSWLFGQEPPSEN